MKNNNKTVVGRSTAILIFSILLPTWTFAQKDAKAKEYLDKSSAAFEKAGALSLQFTLNIKDAPNKLTESFDGTIDVKDAKFHLNTPDNEIWFDGKTQWLLQKDYEEVQVSMPSAQEAQTLNPVVVFNIYKQACRYTYNGEKKDDKGKNVQEVELIPQAKGSEMTRIVMQIGSADYMPTKIHIVYKNKLENIIYINKYQKNKQLTDSDFIFNKTKYPNAEIIDLR